MDKTSDNVESIIKTTVNCAYKVARTLPPGFNEECYKNALLFELVRSGLDALKEEPVNVYYEGVTVGSYRTDILVEGQVIIELKAVPELSYKHEQQLVNYLAATGLDTGLLINFGVYPIDVKRKFRVYKKPVK